MTITAEGLFSKYAALNQVFCLKVKNFLTLKKNHIGTGHRIGFVSYSILWVSEVGAVL
jgi:hypothetical protein